MTDVTTASPALVPFTARFEGTVHRAYRDAGGVITIGDGFTNLSKVFAAYWQQTRGHALKLGDTISDAECARLLGRLLAEEYAPPVAKRFAGAGLRQNQFDAATDVSFNCGPGALKWSWATALAALAIDKAAARLRVTAVTAGGRRLQGLERRRAAEATLLESGDYGAERQSSVGSGQSAEEVRTYQSQLAALGLYAGAIDGQAGKGSLTEGAVMNFQRANDLVVDGIVGPATRAALARALAARTAGQVTGGSAATAGAAGGGADLAQHAAALDWHTLLSAGIAALAVAALVFAGFMLWRYRGVILRRRTAA